MAVHNCKYCKTECGFGGENKKRDCVGYTPMTNADRIRAMTDEELAKLLANEIPHGDCYGCELECSSADGDKFTDCCTNAFYKWLKQPAEE